MEEYLSRRKIKRGRTMILPFCGFEEKIIEMFERVFEAVGFLGIEKFGLGRGTGLLGLILRDDGQKQEMERKKKRTERGKLKENKIE